MVNSFPITFLLEFWDTWYVGKKGKAGACVRRRVVAVLIAVSLLVWLEAVGIHAYTHVPWLGNVSPKRYSKRLPFPSMQLRCSCTGLVLAS